MIVLRFHSHSNLPVEAYVIIGILAIVIWLIRLYHSKDAKVRREMKAVKTKSVRDVKDGEYVRLKGTVLAAREKIKAPLTGRTCVHYTVKVEQKTGGRNRYWKTIIEEEWMADVVLEDNGHYAIVDANYPMTSLVADGQLTSGLWDEPTPESIKYLKKHGYDSTNIIGMNKTMRYSEGVLEPDEEFTIAGYGHWVETKTQKIKVPSDRVLIISKTGEKPVYISDDPDTVAAEGM